MALTQEDDDPAVVSTDPAESGAELMGRLRPCEPAGWQLARARILGSLFGRDSGLGSFGRFDVRERLGAGGMGVVYEAYDPKLARGVALKLVEVTATGRDTALDEAQALARLSHPNVVPIHDVGIEADHVYLVMELVRGPTLRDWPAGRTARDIVSMYRQAGAGLAAAHGVGLVHRDFKPDNAIVGGDGRVRVVDFGLACEADDPARPAGEPRRPAGTPRYMAPEIKAGRSVTPAADQYSFAVALDEALAVASSAVPRHVSAALARGRAPDPVDRFASMAELLRVLDRDPARTRRRIAAATGVAVALGAVAYALGSQNGSALDVCDGGAGQLAAVWPRPARAAALDRIAALGGHGRSLRPVLDRALDSHARRWTAQYRTACIDSHSGTESATLIDRRTACLDRGKDALAAVALRLAQAGPDDLAELPRALQAMPDPEDCQDQSLLLSEVPPPRPDQAVPVATVRRQITRARVDIGGGAYQGALDEATAAVAGARALGYAPLLAEALLVQGHARMNLADRSAAASPLTEALSLAAALRDDTLEVEAWARRVFARGTWTGPDGTQAGLDVIEPVARRPQTSLFVRALLYNNLGTAELAGSHRAEARRYFERALAESQRITGRAPFELISIRENLAFVTDDRRRADQLLVETARAFAERLGDDHPDTLHAQAARGAVTVEDLRTADAVLTPVCRAYETWSLASRTAECWREVGLVRLDLGERDRALPAMTAAVQARRDDAEAAAYVAWLSGDPRLAARQLGDALAAHPPRPDDHWWDRLSRAQLQLGLGRARCEAGDLRGARDVLEAAVADLDDIVRDHPQANYERRLGRAQAELAVTLAALRTSRAHRAEVAARAVTWLRRVGGTADDIAAVESAGR